jgi:hypothetical protein
VPINIDSSNDGINGSKSAKTNSTSDNKSRNGDLGGILYGNGGHLRTWRFIASCLKTPFSGVPEVFKAGHSARPVTWRFIKLRPRMAHSWHPFVNHP